MDALDKLFVICAAISIIITAAFGYLVLKAQGWPLAILTALIMLPLLLISGLSTSETLSNPFGTTNRQGELKVHPVVPVIMSIIYYAVIAAVLFFVFNFARLI